MTLLALLLGCAPPPALSADDTDTGTTPPVAFADLPDLAYGATVIVGPATVATPLLRDRTAFYVQEPGTGAGLEVRAGLRWEGPPPVGSSVVLELLWVGSARAPAAWLSREAGLIVLPEPAELLVLDAPAAPPPLAIGRWAGVSVLTETDPSGRARLSDGRVADARFGVALPPRGNTGTLTGLLLPDGAIAPRDDADWVGPREVIPAVDTTLAEVVAGAFLPGVVVRVPATQASPWSRDGRWVVLQDATGQGVWLDTEGWSLRATLPRDQGTWEAEVVDDGDRRSLRGWRPPEIVGRVDFDVRPFGAVTADELPEDGAVIEVDVRGLGPPDALGERTAEGGLVLDDRFRDLSTLAADARVRGAVERRDGRVVLAVTRDLTPAP